MVNCQVTPERLPDAVEVALLVTTALDRIGVPYVIGGSFASSLYGQPRSTNDVDLVADLRPPDVVPFAGLLRETCYVDEDAMRAAVERGESFNIIHLATAVKVDVFVAAEDVFDRERLTRRRKVQLDVHHGSAVYVDTPESTILRKLEL